MAGGVVKTDGHSVPEVESFVPSVADIPAEIAQLMPMFSKVWIISESERTSTFLQEQLQKLGIICARSYLATTIAPKMSEILTKMHAERPDFVWISSLHHDAMHPLDEKVRIAARLIIAEQHGMGGQFLLENVNMNNDGRGIYLSSEWQASNCRGTSNPIFWCSMGLVKPKLASNRVQNCALVQVFTSLRVPITLQSCCSNSKLTGRSVLPSRYPKGYYTAMAVMVHDVISTPSVPEAIYKTQKKQKPKPPQPTPNESPGDHTDTTSLDKPTKNEMENTFDDCGDDTSTIALNDNTSTIAFSDVNLDEYDSDDDGTDQLFNDQFYNWAFTGSTTCMEEPLHKRPQSLHFPSMSSAFAALGHDKRYDGQHDLCELFGGESGTTKVCIRRGLKTGPSFDISIGIDLTSSVEIQHLWLYLERHRPKVVVAGPPCTSFGPWSRINRYKAYDTWRKNRLIGEKLAKLTAEVCWYQLQHGRHFIVENPEQSEMWSLPGFLQLLADHRVHTAMLDQCMVGLVDPTNTPTKKPTRFIASDERLVKRLHRRCTGGHIHALLAGSVLGASRCKFAQVWPRRLVELLTEGIIEVLRSTTMYPAIKAVADPYGGQAVAPTVCPGCRSHARQDNPRHNRVPGVCDFPYSDTKLWECQACKSNKPSTHQGHMFDESCQWTDAPMRQRGAKRQLPGILKDPRIKAHETPTVAKADDVINVPPAPAGHSWTALQDLELITLLDQCRQHDGWHRILDWTALVQTNGRSLRSPEPRLDGQIWKFRSSFAFYPDCEHSAGNWWQLEHCVDWSTRETERVIFGYPVPILVQIYHKEAEQARPKKIIPDVKRVTTTISDTVGLPASSSDNPFRKLTDQWDAEEQSDQLPPEAQPAPEQTQEPEQINIIPEWSSYDLGASLRALRSDSIPQQNRALRRLHLRWWHASTSRMESLLKAAGVSADVLKRIAPTVESCAICRMWQRPGHRSITTTRMAEKFGQSVQLDLLFIEEHVVLHLIDEAIRWTATALLSDRQTQTILSAITSNWIRLYGPMESLVSDQEGAVASEEGAVWAERWKINLKLKAKSQHAQVVERHHAILRDHLHKILAQLRSEKITINFADVLAEATFVKNAMLQIAGTTPYVALLGRFPQILADFESQGQSALTDSDGGILGASRHSVRLRELAVIAITQSQAQQRMQQAERSRTRPTGQLADIRCGDLCDIYRQPQSKDLTGWRGPTEVVDTSTIDRGFISVRWGGRTMSVRMQDLRKSALFVGMTDDGSTPLQLVRQYLLGIFNAVMTLSWVFGADGWRLSKTASEHPDIFTAILFIAQNELSITKCIGARLGRGVHILHGLAAVEISTLMWWPASRPQLYRTLQHNGNQTIELKQLIQLDELGDTCWIQFMSTTGKEARKLRRNNPDVTMLAPDPDDDMDTGRDDSTMDDATTRREHDSPMLDPSPSPSKHDYPSPFDLPDNNWQRIRLPQIHTDRSRSSRGPSSKYPSPVVSRDAERRPVPSGAEVTTTKRSRPSPTTPVPSHKTTPSSPAGNSSASSSWQGQGTENNTSSASNPAVATTSHTPLLPILEPADIAVPSDDDLSSEGTNDYSEFLVMEHGDSIIMTFFAEDGTAVVSRDLTELLKKDVELHWKEVEKAVRKELASFAELGAFRIVLKGTTGNVMSSRWVHRFKMLVDEAGNKTKGVKSRLTVHGFKDQQADTLLTYASTAARWAQRIITAQAAQNKWHILTADVGNAFLRGLSFKELARLTGEVERKCAFLPPKGYESYVAELPGMSHFDPEKHELLMEKAIYGLKDAPRAWRITLHATLVELKGKSIKTDNAVYFWHTGRTLSLVLSAHVDDLKITGTTDMINWLLEELTARFGALKVQWNKFEHCGLIYEQFSDFSIAVSQNHYTLGLKPIDMTAVDATKIEVALTTSQHSDYLSLLGGLSWLSQTRLDVAIYVQALQRAAQKPLVANLIRINSVTKWVRRKPSTLLYIRLEGPLKVVAISDAAFRREDKTGLAMRGAVIALCEKHTEQPGGRIQIIDFYSRRQRRIVRSTFGAELNSLVDAFETAKLVAFTLAELQDPNMTTATLRLLEETGRFPISIEAVVDCKSIFDSLVPSDTRIPNEASLIMLLLSLKEAMRVGTLSRLWWCDTADMLADGLNKGLVSRRALLETSATGIWKLIHPALGHSDKPLTA